MTTLKLSKEGPIDINKNSNITSCSNNNCILKFYYNLSNIRLKMKKNHLHILFDKNNYITYNNIVYKLKYVTFSNKSSHMLNSKQYDLELYLVHQKYTNPKHKFVMSVFITKSNDIYTHNKFFKKFRNIKYPENNNTLLVFDHHKKLNAYDILPESKKFYEYGDTNNNRKTINIVFKNSININEKIINNIKNYLSKLPKEIQIYDGYINFNNNSTIVNNDEKVSIVTDDKLKNKCLDIYKDRPKEFNKYKKYRYFYSYINIIKYGIILFLIYYFFYYIYTSYKDIINYSLNEIKQYDFNINYIFLLSILIIIIILFNVLKIENINKSKNKKLKDKYYKEIEEEEVANLINSPDDELENEFGDLLESNI